MAASVNKHYTSPFPPLQLTPASAFELETLAQKFVARSIGTYERFLIDDHGKADETRWKLLSAKDGLRAYAEQPRGNDANVSYEEETPITDLPVVMITGTMVGNLDDIMYGVICNTTELMRIKTSYIHDDLVGSCVLASLATPTPENPFNATDIKWVEVKVPLATRPIIKNRDFVYLETTGIERLRNGERVGYHYVHSVQFPETPVRDSTVRGNSSIGVIFRQRDRDVTDVFIKAYFNPAGGLVRAITLRSAARLLLSVANNAYCSNMKKLVWAIRQKYAADTSSSSSDGGVSAVATSDEKSCSGCGSTN
ncbi:hypothetical protein PHYBOEH_005439 [Phytophthora boehmeriae]|uniref:START domain-containing protein n=1 Tax=Phytophthora boehmeriae TaxID=109152 RepID=A0A8T1WLS1_9STRA|nr:hypothetical protein PHYBOEH_005439 [Phytophthora boehmeriae]